MNKKTYLNHIDSSFGKKIISILLVMFNIILGILLVQNLKRWGILENEDRVYTIVILILFILLTFCSVRRFINKKGRTSFNYMKKLCTYNELNEFLYDEKFSEKIKIGTGFIAYSKLWVVIDGVFVPKNYIYGVYTYVNVKKYQTLICLCIDGRKVLLNAGRSKENHYKALCTLRKAVPGLKLLDSDVNNKEEIAGKLKLWFNRELVNTSYEKLIYSRKSFDLSKIN